MSGGESLEMMLERHGFEIDGETYARMNGTAEEILRSASIDGPRPEALLDDVELEIRAYGPPRFYLMPALDLVLHLDTHGGNTPTDDDQGDRP